MLPKVVNLVMEHLQFKCLNFVWNNNIGIIKMSSDNETETANNVRCDY